MPIELDTNTMRCISLFESLTNAATKDCLILDDKIVVFIVRKGELGKAIGRKGSNINRVRTAFKNKRVLVFEDSSSIEGFIKNLFPNINLLNIDVQEKVVTVTVESKNRGSAIGRDGEKIKTNKAILKRKFNCDLKLETR
ncbi:NusA-like transcription termination signal-binding factor [Candidatus Micrarchaeota archaeon]|jgi:N utilization substance protein A|nr:NusA-like transcription termination signal-binding factor [Candidatus Micrarchaeota archaeon]